jgi:hypothetical protein
LGARGRRFKSRHPDQVSGVAGRTEGRPDPRDVAAVQQRALTPPPVDLVECLTHSVEVGVGVDVQRDVEARMPGDRPHDGPGGVPSSSSSVTTVCRTSCIRTGIPLLGMQIAAGLAILVLAGATSVAVATEAAADPPTFICAKTHGFICAKPKGFICAKPKGSFALNPRSQKSSSLLVIKQPQCAIRAGTGPQKRHL